MKKIVALLTGLLLLSSCRSVSYDDLNPTIQPNDNLLPVYQYFYKRSSRKYY